MITIIEEINDSEYQNEERGCSVRIAICENEVAQQKIIKEQIITCMHKNAVEIHTFISGEVLSSVYQKGERFDIIFMDIRMREMDGIETIKGIRQYDKKVIIIIVTATIEYAVEGYSIRANDFILKPIIAETFKKVFDRAVCRLESKGEEIYTVENKEGIIHLDLDDIYYIESDGRQVRIKSKRGVFRHYRKISIDEKKLESKGFIRIHRSILVNMENVYRIQAKEVVLTNHESLPLSIKKHKQIYDAYTSFMIRRVK